MGFFSKFKEEDSEKAKGNGNSKVVGYEEPTLDINLNIGTTGVRSADKDISKKYDYEKIRSDVDLAVVKRMIQILDKVETKTQFFTQLEDDEIPLITLVALGITSEESINAYRTLRARGLDTYKADVTTTQSVDDEYRNEVMANTVELPQLSVLGTGLVDEPLTSEELYRAEVKNRIKLEEDLRDAERKIRRLEERKVEPEPTYTDVVKQEIVDLHGILEEEEDTSAEDEEQLSTEEFKSWNSEFDKLKEVVYGQKKEEEEQEQLDKATVTSVEDIADDGQYQAVKSVHKVSIKEKQDKEIYVLSEPFELEEELDGYKVIFVSEPNDLVIFTASKDNLLVITRAIPSQLVDMFIEWVGSVSMKGIKIRAVTLKGLEVKHAVIEGEIELTQESLDNYYEQNKMSKYVGTGVGTFFDLEASLDGL